MQYTQSIMNRSAEQNPREQIGQSAGSTQGCLVESWVHELKERHEDNDGFYTLQVEVLAQLSSSKFVVLKGDHIRNDSTWKNVHTFFVINVYTGEVVSEVLDMKALGDEKAGSVDRR